MGRLKVALITLAKHIAEDLMTMVWRWIVIKVIEERVNRSLVLCVCFVDRCLSFCTFSFGHCVVCSSSTYGFWLLFDIFKLFLLTLGFNGISNHFEKLTYTYISLVLSLCNGIPCILEKNNTSTNKYSKVFSFQSTCIRFQLNTFFWPNYVPTFVVKFKPTFIICLHDRITSLSEGGVCVHKTSLTPATFYWSACTKPGQKVSMYLCVRGIHFVSFYDFDIWFWKCSVSVVFFFPLYTGTISVMIIMDYRKNKK